MFFFSKQDQLLRFMEASTRMLNFDLISNLSSICLMEWGYGLQKQIFIEWGGKVQEHGFFNPVQAFFQILCL